MDNIKTSGEARDKITIIGVVGADDFIGIEANSLYGLTPELNKKIYDLYNILYIKHIQIGDKLYVYNVLLGHGEIDNG